MPTRKYKTDPADLLAEGQRIAKSNEDAQYLHKVNIVNLVLAGLTPSFLSEYCGESKNTITLWVKKADEEGFESLRPKPHPGRPAKLTGSQLKAIQAVLAEDAPKSYGYSVWDSLSLSDYISKTYSVELGVRQCQRLFHRLGFSLVRPQTFPSKDDEDSAARETFKKN